MKITRTKRARIVSRDPEDFDCAVEMTETIELSDNLRPSIRFSNCTVEKDLIDDLIQNTLSTNSRAEFVFQNCNIKRKRRSSEIELAEKFDEGKQNKLQTFVYRLLIKFDTNDFNFFSEFGKKLISNNNLNAYLFFSSIKNPGTPSTKPQIRRRRAAVQTIHQNQNYFESTSHD